MTQAQLLERGSAVISTCGRYRYRLDRKISDKPRTVNFIMLNPSTADAETDDPTIRRCIAFARAWGCGRLIVTNLFAVRATDPDDMLAADDPVGPENARYVEAAAHEAFNIYAPGFKQHHGLVVCAWGNHGVYMDQDRTTMAWIDPFRPLALRVTKFRQPQHPLYLSADCQGSAHSRFRPQLYGREILVEVLGEPRWVIEDGPNRTDNPPPPQFEDE